MAEIDTPEVKRYVTCEFHHSSCVPGFGHYESANCVNPQPKDRADEDRPCNAAASKTSEMKRGSSADVNPAQDSSAPTSLGDPLSIPPLHSPRRRRERSGALRRGTAALSRRTATITRRTAIRQRSVRKAGSDTELDTAKAIVRRRSGGRCEAPQHSIGCRGRAEHVHHVKLRSAGGTHDPANLLDLSGACHSWWHLHRDEARRLGIIVDSKAAAL